MADKGLDLAEEFLTWLRCVDPIKKGEISRLILEKIHDKAESEEYKDHKARQPFIREEGEDFIYRTESFNHVFDMVLAIGNKETKDIRSIFPIEFKSNSDRLDERLQKQIASHLIVFGVSVLVLDSRWNNPKYFKRFNVLPSLIFVRSEKGFTRANKMTYWEYPHFYGDNLSRLLPKGYKNLAPKMLPHLKNLNSIMRKLYASRLINGLGDVVTDFDFNESEVKTLVALLITLSAEEAKETFAEIAQRFEKFGKKLEALGQDEPPNSL